MEGHRLLPLLDGKDDGKERYALSESFRRNSSGRMIRDGDWKYCYFPDDREQLFDLRNDPDEVVNLAGNPRHKELHVSLKTAKFLQHHSW